VGSIIALTSFRLFQSFIDFIFSIFIYCYFLALTLNLVDDPGKRFTRNMDMLVGWVKMSAE
jgi:hypothetical protein